MTTKYHTQKLLIKFQTLDIKKSFIKCDNNTLQQLCNTHKNKISIQRYDQKFQYKNIANISKNNNDEKKNFIQQKHSNKLQ